MHPSHFSFIILSETDIRQFQDFFAGGLCYDRSMNIPKRARSNIEIKIIKNSYRRTDLFAILSRNESNRKERYFKRSGLAINSARGTGRFSSIRDDSHPGIPAFSKRSSPINISCLISSDIFMTTKYEFRLFSTFSITISSCTHDTYIDTTRECN